MESVGRLVDVAVSYETRRRRLTFEVDNVSDDELNRLYACESVDIRAVKHREKRSLNANAYHWVLCGAIAKELKIGNQEAHKRLMLKYGAISVENGVAQYVIVKAEYDPRDDQYWLPAGEIYLENKKGKKRHIIYWLIKESHLYNSAEMASLIDGTIADAKELGIETLPPREIEKMKEAWSVKAQ